MSRDSFFCVCCCGFPRPTLPIRHSPAAAQCRPPLGYRDCSCFDLLATSIRKSGLEIENRCTDCPCFDLFAASIRKFELEIKNRCNTIVPASITARLLQVVAATMPRPIPIFVASKKNCPPAALSLSQGRTARLLFCRCRRDEWPACSFVVVSGKSSPPAE